MRNKKLFTLLSAALLLGFWRLYSTGQVPITRGNLSVLDQENSARKLASSDAKQCSIFNQTDEDIFNQKLEQGDIIFSGCDGFF